MMGFALDGTCRLSRCVFLDETRIIVIPLAERKGAGSLPPPGGGRASVHPDEFPRAEWTALAAYAA